MQAAHMVDFWRMEVAAGRMSVNAARERIQQYERPAFARASDWSPELHCACDKLENAVGKIAQVVSVDQLDCQLIELRKARKEFGALVLQLNRQRRMRNGHG